MGRLNDKDILITGGTSGIGLACARLFIEQGARVTITGRNETKLTAARESLPGTVNTLCADVREVGQIEKMAAELRDTIGGLDGLLVNAGVAKFKPHQEMDEATFDEVISTNVKGTWFTLAKCAPLMRTGGAMVITSSIAPYKGQTGVGVYAASKAAARSMARSFSAELRDRQIRVLALSPGPIRTPIYDDMGTPEEVDAMLERMTRRIPAGRFGTPEEVAQAALFMLSDESSFMLGAELILDGGKSQL